MECGEFSSTRNSTMTGKRKNIPEINFRFIYAMRAIGQGLLGGKTFCGIMDLPSPVTYTAYNKIITNMKNITTVSASRSMMNAVTEEIMMNEKCSDVTVSGDGTWKTRGHTSLIGVCTLIGGASGIVVEAEVLSSNCKGCASWKGVRKGKAFNNWSKEHAKICQKKHTGSAGMMEVVGMQRIFERSEAKYGICYAHYIGDGDCKTFSAIEKAKPYRPNFPISKHECVGHIQKRMGAKLRRRKQDMKGKKLADEKTISGKGRLTDDVINKLTIYYGNVIRSHCDSVKDMQKSICAVFFHNRSNDLEPTHNFCPVGKDSWCAYQRAVANKTVEKFFHTNSVPTAVMDSIKDIFKDLSMPSLLKKGLGGHTQNANESFNSLIWKLCPKTSGSAFSIVKIAVNEATVLFNEDQIGRINTMKDFGFKIGENARNFAVEFDKRRIAAAERMGESSTLEARRARKRAKLAAEEAVLLKEGEVYASGMF